MASSPTAGGPGNSVEPGWPFGGRPTPERVWSLWKNENVLQTEMNPHPLGYEVRVYVDGDYLYSFLRPARQLAEQEARELKLEKLARGWTDWPGEIGRFSVRSRRCSHTT